MITSNFASLRSMPRTSQMTIAAVGLLVLLTLGLLYRTEANAASVSRATQHIATAGRGLNTYTDSIAQLGTTNRLIDQISTDLDKVNGNLTGIDATTRSIADKADSIHTSTASIDGSTTSINSSEHSIDGSVSKIGAEVRNLNESLVGINGNASQILAASLAIQRGVALISSNLATARSITNEILSEATDLRAKIRVTNHEAACVDNGLNGGQQC